MGKCLALDSPHGGTAPAVERLPLPQPREWIEHVNRPQSEAEGNAIRRRVARGQPLGSAPWTEQTAREPRLESTPRSRGRPRNPDCKPDHD